MKIIFKIVIIAFILSGLVLTLFFGCGNEQDKVESEDRVEVLSEDNIYNLSKILDIEIEDFSSIHLKEAALMLPETVWEEILMGYPIVLEEVYWLKYISGNDFPDFILCFSYVEGHADGFAELIFFRLE